MPQIIGAAEQRAALHKISAALKKVEGMNVFLDAENPTGEYTISFKNAEGKTISAPAISTDKADVNSLIQNYKDSIVREMTQLAEKNRIWLDEQDKRTFGMHVPDEEVPHVPDTSSYE